MQPSLFHVGHASTWNGERCRPEKNASQNVHLDNAVFVNCCLTGSIASCLSLGMSETLWKRKKMKFKCEQIRTAGFSGGFYRVESMLNRQNSGDSSVGSMISHDYYHHNSITSTLWQQRNCNGSVMVSNVVIHSCEWKSVWTRWSPLKHTRFELAHFHCFCHSQNHQLLDNNAQ